MLGLGFLRPPQGAQDSSEVAAAGQGVGVLGAQAGAADLDIEGRAAPEFCELVAALGVGNANTGVGIGWAAWLIAARTVGSGTWARGPSRRWMVSMR